MTGRSFPRILSMVVAAFLAAGLFAAGSSAQPRYPMRPITLLVPWAAGGGTDRISRMVASLLERELGVPVTVVNRTGGGGAVGHTAGATAIPDAYTITMVTVEITMMHWMGLARVTHKDFRPVALLNYDPAGISVSATAPWHTYRELHEYIRANPGRLKASGTGPGGIWDLARAGWLKAAGFPTDAVRWVPSAGAAPALAELVAGGVDIVTASLPEAAPLIAAGRVRALAIMADRRDPLFPNVPTLKELGINWSVGAWRGIAVPKFTPTTAITVLERALAKVVEHPDFKDFMQKNGFGILYRPARDFAKFMEEQDRVMGQLMREVGLAR